jgi:hypothetical protein
VYAAFRFGAHGISQDHKWEVVHTALLCTVHPQIVRTRLQHVQVDSRRIGAGRRTIRHGMTAVGAPQRRRLQLSGCAGLPAPGAVRLRCPGEPNGACRG